MNYLETNENRKCEQRNKSHKNKQIEILKQTI